MKEQVEMLIRMGESKIEDRLAASGQIKPCLSQEEIDIHIEELASRFLEHCDQLGGILQEIYAWLENGPARVELKTPRKPGAMHRQYLRHKTEDLARPLGTTPGGLPKDSIKS